MTRVHLFFFVEKNIDAHERRINATIRVYMLLKAFGKFAGGFIALSAGIVLLAYMCRGDTCGSVFSAFTNRVSKERSENIRVEVPYAYDSIQSPFTVRGTARVFEGTVFYTLTDALGKSLAEGKLRTKGVNEKAFLPFEGSIFYGMPGAPAGTLELYDVSPKDGVHLDRLEVTVSFSLP